MTQSDLYTILPTIILVAWACLLLLVDLFIPKGRKGWTALLAAVGLAGALGVTLAQAGMNLSAFGGMVVLDGFSSFLNVLFLASGLGAIAIAYGYLKRMGLERGEYYTLMLFSLSGMLLMAQAADLIVVFLSLELLSIPLYVLSAFARPRTEFGRGRPQVLPVGSLRHRFRRLRHRPGLRRHRQHLPRRDRLGRRPVLQLRAGFTPRSC